MRGSCVMSMASSSHCFWPCESRRAFRARERHEAAEWFLERVHLLPFARRFVHQLSGGMRQRAALARALALDPQVLLMDEPFGALDALSHDLLQELLEALWQDGGKTILFVTHNVREAVALGNRVMVFRLGPVGSP